MPASERHLVHLELRGHLKVVAQSPGVYARRLSLEDMPRG
jgi:hypothetical protein